MGAPERVRTEIREEVTYQTKKKQNRTGSSESSESLLSPNEGDLKEALIQPEGHGVEDLSYRIQSLVPCLS